MSVETSQRMFAELAYLDPGNAEQQALPGNVWSELLHLYAG